MNIAEKAISLVCGDRNASYGNPRDDYVGTAKIWSGLLRRKLREDITPEEALLMMVALKLNRESFKPKEDNRVDAIGYLLCLDWATTGEKPTPLGQTSQSSSSDCDQGSGDESATVVCSEKSTQRRRPRRVRENRKSSGRVSTQRPRTLRPAVRARRSALGSRPRKAP